MLISHRHKFIFIHVQKTGGTSISAALEPYCERTLEENGRLGLHSHATAAEIRRVVGDSVWNSYFKFAIERNPWDRTLSGYYYQLQNTDQFRKCYWRSQPSFEEWMFPLPFIPKKHKSTFRMYALGDRMAVDFLGRYESLSADFTEICRQIGLDDVQLPVRNQSPQRSSRDYRSCYSPRSRDRVARIYRREIDLLGYTF